MRQVAGRLTFLFLESKKPRCIPPIYLNFYVSINIYIIVGLCITSIGIVWYRSCIKIFLPYFPWVPYYFSSCTPLAYARHSYRKSVEVGLYWKPLVYCRSLYNYCCYNSLEDVYLRPDRAIREKRRAISWER
jgi:hypothetical protein